MRLEGTSILPRAMLFAIARVAGIAGIAGLVCVAACSVSLGEGNLGEDEAVPLPDRTYADDDTGRDARATEPETDSGPAIPLDAGDAGVDANTGPKRVFASSSLRTGNLGGLAGADALCNQLATAKGFSGTFVAWLSVSGTTAATRITGNGPWQRVDGTVVAQTKAELTSGTLRARIDRDENGTTLPGDEDRVWTATSANGSYAGGDCNGWTQTNGGGRVGEAEHTNGDWTSLGEENCGEINRVYCFQQ